MREQAMILLIDDDDESNRLVDAALTAAGYQVVVASHYREIKRQLAAGLPDVILIGLEKPTTQGAGVIAMLRSHARTARIPIIGISYRGQPVAEPEHRPMAELPKPLNSTALVEAVRRCLDQGLTPPVPGLLDDEGAPGGLPDLQPPLMERLTSETVRIQEEERRKLSLELHDEIAQILGNLILMIDASMAVAPPEAKKLQQYLADARRTAKEGFRRVQHFSVELRPPILDDLGLAPTILWYAERFTRDNAIPVEVSLPDRLPPLTGEQETALFRIVQESLNNVLKHARARRVSVTVQLPPGAVRLTVRDDGQGFNPDEVEHKMVDGIHLGLAGMRYRAGLLKGRLEISSEPGRGTAITAEIPLTKEQAPRAAGATDSQSEDGGRGANR